MGESEKVQTCYPALLVKLTKYGLAILLLFQIFMFVLSSSGPICNWLPTPVVTYFNSSSWSKKPVLRTEQHVVNKPQILIWTTFYAHPGLEGNCLDILGQKRQDEICKYSCAFTTDREQIETSHVVVFHGRDIQTEEITLANGGLQNKPVNLPLKRNLNQYWTFLMFESQVYTWINLAGLNSIFNWTMSFRQDSDVYIPYGNLVKINSTNLTSYNNYYYKNQESPFRSTAPKTFPNFVAETKKAGLVAWITSNCLFQQSGRESLASELQKYVTVDIYGKCGKKTCQISNGDVCDSPINCYQSISKLYKFYLAFENSLCEEYVTEKFFNALLTDLVPVVYGRSNYSMYAPKGSFINVLDFESVKHLADYLIYLNNNESAYLEYFKWKNEYYVEDIFYIERAWCSVCAKAWQTFSIPIPTSHHQSQSKQSVNLTRVSDITSTSSLRHNSSTSTVVHNLNEWWHSRNRIGYSTCVESKSTLSRINLNIK